MSAADLSAISEDLRWELRAKGHGGRDLAVLGSSTSLLRTFPFSMGGSLKMLVIDDGRAHLYAVSPTQQFLDLVASAPLAEVELTPWVLDLRLRVGLGAGSGMYVEGRRNVVATQLAFASALDQA